MTRPLALLGLLALGGCSTNEPLLGGDEIYRYFPFNGTRTWAYRADEQRPYRMVGSRVGEVEEVDGVAVYTLRYVAQCVGQAPPCGEEADGGFGDDDDTDAAGDTDLGADAWLAPDDDTDAGQDTDPPDDADDDIEGDFDGSELLRMRMSADSVSGVLLFQFGDRSFDPPLRLANARMRVGETVTSSSSGVDLSVTYAGLDTCDAPYWVQEAPNCLKLEVDDGGAGTGMAGDWYGAALIHLAVLDIEAFGFPWRLQDFRFEP